MFWSSWIADGEWSRADELALYSWDLHNLTSIGPFSDRDILLGCDSIILIVLTDSDVRGCTKNHAIARTPVANKILWRIIQKQLEWYVEHEMQCNKQDSGIGMGQGTEFLM